MKYRSASTLTSEDIGRRVTVRARLREGGTTDTIGFLEALDSVGVRVRRADGEIVEISLGDVVAARVISGKGALPASKRPVEMPPWAES
jgi:hypothetical protein